MKSLSPSSQSALRSNRAGGMRLVAWMLPLLVASPLVARPKIDVAVLDNGDRLTCEIKKLERGQLTVKIDASGTITVKWSRVMGIGTDFPFQLELQSRRSARGSGRASRAG